MALSTEADRGIGSQTARSFDTFQVNEVSTDNPEKRRRCCNVQLPPFRVFVTIVACVGVEATLGVTYTTGNLMPYLTSYLRRSTGDTSLDYSKSLWISNSLFLVMATCTFWLGLLERRMPPRVYLAIGLLCNAVAFFGSYWAVQSSFVATVLVFGVVQGFAQAILYPSCINLAMQWFPQRKGLLGGIAMGGYGGGAFIWNQVVTLWINPSNVQPDLNLDENLYFTQSEVLHKVPTCFLLLGGILTGTQVLCVLSLTYPPSSHRPQEGQEIPGLGGVDGGLQAIPSNTSREKEPSANAMGSSVVSTADGGSDAGDDGTKSSHTEGGATRQPTSHYYTPLQTVTSRATWTLWLVNFTIDLAFFFIPVFYKAYGQTFISDDHLLSLVASFASVFNALGRPVWGLVADRIGYLPSLMINQALLGVMSATIVLCEKASSAAMFFVWVCVIYVAFSGIYALQSPVIFTLYGSRNFVFTLGVVCSTGAVSSFVTVPLADAVSEAFGWRGIFLVAAGGAFMSMLILASLLVSCGHPIPQHMRTGLLAPRRHRLNRRSDATQKYASPSLA